MMIAGKCKTQHTTPNRTSNTHRKASSEARLRRTNEGATSYHRSNSKTKLLRNHQSCSHLRNIRRSNFAQNLCTFVLLYIATCLLRTTSAQFLSTDQNCEDLNTEGALEYNACVGSPEKLFLIALSSSLDLPNATCGSHADNDLNLFCTLGTDFSCDICDANDPALAHPPSNIYDNGENGANTWWQSYSWYDYPTLLHINVTISLGHSYQVGNDITILFKYGRPQLMILEKSADYGETWEVYQYYASDDLGCRPQNRNEEGCDGTPKSGCERQFGMPVTMDTDISSPTEVICTNQYSSTVRSSDTDVIFAINNRISALTPGSFNPEVLAEAFERNTALQDFLDITDLRFRLLMPPTDGLHPSAQRNLFGLGKYFYAISDLDTVVTCNCNLHGKYCISNLAGNETICECFHNTQGSSCDECLPLYNNRPWRSGSSLPWGVGTANACEICDCGDHALSCIYNDTLGYGQCLDCQDNTAGNLCEICINGYYRNETALIEDPNVCIECDCEPLGTIIDADNLTLPCAQYANAQQGLPIGQCPCKDNTRGRACNDCEEGFWGLLVEPDVGTCKDCGCEVLGTIGGSPDCDQLTGQCMCKASTNTPSCGECADSYYAFPSTIQGECTACACDPGGSNSLACNKDSGRCSCRGNISGRQCSNPATLFYCSHLDANSYDAWEASSTCFNTSDSLDRSVFSGRGFQECESGQEVTFGNVQGAPGVNGTRTFYPFIRYSYTSDFDWASARLTVNTLGNSGLTAENCPVSVGQLWQSAMLFPPGIGAASRPLDDTPVALDRRCSYEATLEMQSNGAGESQIQIDAFLLMPNINETLAYQVADVGEQQLYESCVQNMSALSTRDSIIGRCSDFSFSVCAELNGEALRCDCDCTGTVCPNHGGCDCDFTGSLGSVCLAYGGECNCKTGVGGRRCDRCLPGYHSFSSSGCQPCNCNEPGSVSMACDFATGQCPCKAGVAISGAQNSNGQLSGLQCEACVLGYYGFGNTQGCEACNCDVDGSANNQCDNEGFCTCKPTITGMQCTNCVPGYFDFSADGCQSCECDPSGTMGSTCHPTIGTCTCKENVEGDKCDQCKAGYYNMQVENPDGCQPCFCFGHATECSAASGYVAAEVKTDFTRGRTEGWTTTDPTALNMNSNNIRLSQPPNLDAGTFLYLIAPSKFLNLKLSSYGQKISYNMKLDTGNVDTNDAKYLILVGGRTNMTMYYSQEAFEPSIVAATFEALLYESYWTLDVEQRNPTAAEFLEILSDVSSMQIKASFGTGTASTFYSIAIDTARASEAPSGTGYVTTVENCTCTQNTMGLSCESCDIGHRRTQGLSDPYDSCVICNCNNRATECDPETGVCLDCQLGTVGDQCESCAENVLPSACDRCTIGHYGFGTDLFGGACEACNCSAVGTNNNPQCDNLIGQCACVGNYGGMQCDMCDHNYFNFEAGCIGCDDCYNGINSQFEGLDASNTNLTEYVALLLAQNDALNVNPFVQRLTNIQSVLLDLVARTQTVIQEGQDLSTIITSLNTTMIQLLAVLDGPVMAALELTNTSVDAVENGVAAAELAINITTEALINAHNALTGGDIQAKQEILSGLSAELQGIENNFNALTTQSALVVGTLDSQANIMELTADVMVTTAEGAVQKAQEANAIHDNTTSRTAALYVRANDMNTALGALVDSTEATRQESQDERIAVQNKANEVIGINTALPVTQNVVTDATGKVQQAVQIEQSATDQQASNQPIIDAVGAAAIATQTLETDANNTIDTINELHDRVTQASDKADTAKTSVDETFADAQSMLTTVANFNSQVTAAENSADTALGGVQSIVTASNTVIEETGNLRNQLDPAGQDSADGLAFAEEAFNTTDQERLALVSINDRANTLSQDSATSASLGQIATTVEVVNEVNTSYVHPAGVKCDSFTPAIQELEELVNNATSDAAAASARTAATAQRIQQLMTEVQNIGGIDTAGLGEFRRRIQEARGQFTAGEYASVIANLKQGVDSQEAWVTATEAAVNSMKAQMDSLNSFGVN